jgi:hypothetical protein
MLKCPDKSDAFIHMLVGETAADDDVCLHTPTARRKVLRIYHASCEHFADNCCLSYNDCQMRRVNINTSFTTFEVLLFKPMTDYTNK